MSLNQQSVCADRDGLRYNAIAARFYRIEVNRCLYVLKMEGKFQNKYRIASARAPWWDYGQDAAYFVTVCTAGRKPFLGDVVNGIMNYHMWESLQIYCGTK